MKIILWIWARIKGFGKYLVSDARNMIFFILSLPSLFVLFLIFIFSTKLADPFLYKEQKDKDGQEIAYEQDVVFLDQGWLEGYRQKFYFTQQGSHIIPMEIALQLESPNSEQMIFGENGTAFSKFGYLRYPTTKKKGPNPYGLPIGFVEDVDRQGRKILGMNCSACHTANIEYGGKTLRIDGGAALSDFMGLIEEIDTALAATLTDGDKLRRYYARRNITETDARSELGVASAKRQAWQRRNKTEYPHGFARVDAFGIIFNQVVGRDLHLDFKGELGNVNTPVAPASYPVLWDTPFMGRVQWTGGSNNLKPTDPLARNFGQVLGVFGGVEVTTQNSLPGLCSTPDRQNLELYNFWLESLKSPKWEEAADKGVLPKIDKDRAERGRIIYFGGENAMRNGDMDRGCAECHSLVSDAWRNKSDRDKDVCDVPIYMISQDNVRTDRNLIDTGRRTGAKTGRLAGQKSKFTSGKIIDAEEDYMFVLAEMIAGSLVGSFLSASCDGKLTAATLIETANTFGNINRSGAKHKFEKRVGGGFALAPQDLDQAQVNLSNAKEVWNGISGRSGLSAENIKLAETNLTIAKKNLEQAHANMDLPPEDITLPPMDPELFQVDLNKALEQFDQASDNFALYEMASNDTSDDAYLANINYMIARANMEQAQINEVPAPGKKPPECRMSDNYNSYSYKARPLNGIWASAPYLHNGSVPTLYDILLPPLNSDGSCDLDACRPDEFYVGSIEYDPEKVGYVTEQTDMSSIVDTNLKGSSNAGHLYMVDDLSHEQRLDLIEYLKTL